MNINEIELKRKGVEEAIKYCIERYERECPMVVEEIQLLEDNEIRLIDRMSRH